MNCKKAYTFLLATLIAVAGSALPPSYGFPAVIPFSSLPDSYNESYVLLTDRRMYSVGEKIYFTAFNTSSAPLREACWSKVVYVHLLRPDGSSVARGKFAADCYGCSASLAIPEDILTGHYYLCAYTKWMRNFNPTQYAFAPLRIVNPFSAQLDKLSSPNGNRTGGDTIRSRAGTGLKDVPVHDLECLTGKPVYRPGEEVRLNIRYPGVYRAASGHISISAARAGAMDTVLLHDLSPSANESWNGPGPGYLPEIQGLSLSGRILTVDTAGALQNARVELSVFGSNPSLLSYRTNPDGTFCFGLNSMTGYRDMFIAARHPDQADLEIRIDNDFSSPQPKFPFQAFSLNGPERQTAEEIALNMQLEKAYAPSSGSPDTTDETLTGVHSLLGIPTRKLWIDEFIELPNLKEVFIELVPEVMPKTRNRKSYLSFSGNEMTREIMARFDPLILIDQVPVYDIEKLLALSPERIRSIEVINDLYVIGNTSYGGLVSIVSNNGDMGGIDLPEHSIFFRYEGLQETDAGDHTGEITGLDYRNCLYWEPSVAIEPEQSMIRDFRAPDKPGWYLVLIRGVSENGTFLYGSCRFQVSP